ncbi:hypothetical protein [Silvibacterium dinghuense]|uniref:Uncharacterized protein n=1 Tax=Silvibacterium dinghuense TaxID=1560006 RepID=A0A4Q1SBJ6_9BACT|nr:hypothetical protein [Silvibacterium dinghuense]RXS94508.1 hypothetical protein ESZ00_15690 [Silvibacterium dinghuense]GGH15668.1 hypothetical protein GCM10011586_36920 [Silvibacterium dinghuense]
MNVLRSTANFFSEICFGCAHERLSRPFTLEDQCYMVCLQCGTHVPYSQESMRPLTSRELRRMKAVLGERRQVMPMESDTGQAQIAGDKLFGDKNNSTAA